MAISDRLSIATDIFISRWCEKLGEEEAVRKALELADLIIEEDLSGKKTHPKNKEYVEPAP